jgi:hypothetical protein
MKNRLFLALLSLALLTSACSDDPGAANSPVAPGGASIQAPEMYMNLDLVQTSLLAEMTYLQEDMGVLLAPVQLSTYNSLVSTLTNNRDPRRMAVDMEAVAWFNLLYKANPDLDREILMQLRQLIAESAKRRAEILASGASREEITAQLKAEHERLIAAMNRLAGETAVANALKLREDLEQRRKEMQEKMVQKRIDMEVARMKAALGLTDEQAAAVAAVLKYQHDMLSRLREQYRNNPEGFRAALLALQEDIDTRMRLAIGDELWEKWLEIRRGGIRPVEPVNPVDKQVAELTRLLGLTPEQAAQLKLILLDEYKQIQQLRTDPNMDRRELAEKLKQIQKETDARIFRQLGLTDAQIAQYNRWRYGTVVPPVEPKSPIDKQVEHLTKLLSLDEAQAAELKKILTEQQEQIDRLLKDPNMDRRELAQKIAEIQKETERRILEELRLTEEQKQLYLRLKAAGGVRG